MIRRLAGFGGAAALALAVLRFGFPPGAPGAAWTVIAALTAAGGGFLAAGGLSPLLLAACAATGGLGWLAGSGGSRPWPVLLVLAFVAGERFRAALAPPAPAGEPETGPPLRALLVLWTLGAAASIASARTEWAFSRGLWGRVVNVQGMTDVEVARQAVLSLAVVLAGILLLGVLRRLRPPERRRAVAGLLAGAALSGAVAAFQAWELVSAPRAGFWRLTGRFQGLASDPNALGVLLGLCLGPAAAGALRSRGGARRAAWGLAAAAMAIGLFASGSRSGLIIAAGGLLILLRPQGRARRAKTLLASAAVLALVFAALLLGGRSRGNLGRRLLESFNREVPLAGRTSSRPLLWKAAWIAWERRPVGGIGWNAYSWHLPNLAAEMGISLPGYDNPGNFYLEALCETGAVGLALFLLFAAGVGRSARAASREALARHDPRLGAAAGSLLGFLAALFVGSHLLAAEGAIAFFALLALADPGETAHSRPGLRPALAGAVILAALSWLPSIAATNEPDAAFRYSTRIGIYGMEPSPGGEFRWMRRRAAWRLEAGGHRRVRLVAPVPDGKPARIEIRAGGKLLWRGRASQHRAAIVTLQAARDRPTIFFFESSFHFVPGASGPTVDLRELAVQIYELPTAKARAS